MPRYDHLRSLYEDATDFIPVSASGEVLPVAPKVPVRYNVLFRDALVGQIRRTNRRQWVAVVTIRGRESFSTPFHTRMGAADWLLSHFPALAVSVTTRRRGVSRSKSRKSRADT